MQMYTFHNMKLKRLSQISSVDKKESECLNLVKIFSFSVLWSVYWPPFPLSNTTFSALISPLGDSCRTQLHLFSRGQAVALTDFSGHICSLNEQNTDTHQGFALTVFYFLLGSTLFFQNRFSSACSIHPQYFQVFWKSRDKAPDLLPLLKPLDPAW